MSSELGVISSELGVISSELGVISSELLGIGLYLSVILGRPKGQGLYPI